MEITAEVLKSLGWDTIHWNAKWNGGWWEYYKEIEDLKNAKIKVTFGDSYSEDFMVWIEADYTSIAMKHIRTMQQLSNFYQLVTGQQMKGE